MSDKILFKFDYSDFFTYDLEKILNYKERVLCVLY